MLGKLSTWKDDSVKLAITIERCSMQLMKTLWGTGSSGDVFLQNYFLIFSYHMEQQFGSY